MTCRRNRSRALPWARVVIASWLSSAACASEPARPPELGDCVPVGDASCVEPANGAGGSSPVPEASVATDQGETADDGDAQACGTVVTLQFIAGVEPPCASCVTASCCNSALDCSEDPTGECSALVQCDALSTFPSCFSALPDGNGPYTDFANCVDLNCPSPQCPTLPGNSFGSDL